MRSRDRGMDITWFYWLERRSVFRITPGLLYLFPYLLGIGLWRLEQVQFAWQQQELLILPYLFLGVVLTGYCLRSYWWRFWLVFKACSGRVVVCLLLLIIGYGWSDYQWSRTDLDRFLSQADTQLWIKGRIIAIEDDLMGQGDGKAVDVQWLVRPQAVFAGQIELPVLGGISKFYPKLQVKNPQFQEYQPQIGDLILLVGQWEKFSTATNPGQFDYQRFQRYSGLVGVLPEPEVYPLSRPRYHLLRGMARIKQQVYQYFAKALQRDHLPLVISLLTGESDFLPEEELAQIRALGLSHLLAISGLHLGLVVSVLRLFLRYLPLSRRVHSGVLITAIWFAVIFVGARPSALRVGIYLTLSQVGELLGRRLHSINLLAITAYIILLVNPLTLFLLSFQLSFMVYLTILLCYQPIHQLIKGWLPEHWLIRPLGEPLALSVTAFLGSSPVLLYHFYEVSFQGIVMNLWAVPLIGMILIGSLLTLVVGVVLPDLGIYVSWGLDYLVGWFRGLVKYFYQLGDLSWRPGRPSLFWVGTFYFLGWLGWRIFQRKDLPSLWVQRERREVWIYLLIFLGVVGLSIFLPISNPRLEWVLLDVGQGDGMFLQMPNGFTMLIDGGGKLGSRTFYTGEKILKPFLLSRRIKKIDLLCITHFDADHVQGLLTVLRDFQVSGIWMSKGSESGYVSQVTKVADLKEIPIIYPTRGDVYRFGEVMIEVLHPEQGERYEKENDRSVVLRLIYGDRKVLLTGDFGEQEEEKLLEEVKDLGVDFLKVGHHGSKYATSDAFLKRVNPKLAVISVGQNRYGHPAPELLKRLADQGCTVLRTDESGAIQVLIGDQQVKIDKFQQK